MAKYDLAVIGGGPGGYVAAIRGAQLGKKVVLIEKDRLGGTCLNRGCIPTKVMLYTAALLREFENAEELGILVESPRVDYEKMSARRKKVVDQLVSGVEGLISANGIDLISGKGTVSAKGLIDVDGEKIEADNIILATGATPSVPNIPGLDLPGVVTSDDLLTGEGLKTPSLIIIGGGVIGMEIAEVFNALGTMVTVIEAMPRVLPGLDKEISQNISMIAKKRGISINTDAMVEKVTKGDDGCLNVTYTVKGEQKIETAKNVLVAIGRRPNTEGLLSTELEAEAKKERGYFLTDQYGETSIKGIYAVGDIVYGGIQLAHAASAQGLNAVNRIFGSDAEKDGEEARDLSLVPSCIYTDPEIASVGITEAAAKEQGIAYKVGKALTGSNGKTLIESGERGYVKLIFGEDEKLLGAQIVSKRATDMIGGLASAIASGTTAKKMAGIIWPHPTFSEVIGEAVEDALGGAIHAMPRRKR